MDTFVKHIQNKRAYHDYTIMDTYSAGIALLGSEVKSIKLGWVSFTDSFCYFKDNNLILKNLHVSPYHYSKHVNHEPLREKQLLLRKAELRKLKEKVKAPGFSIVPLFIYTTGDGKIKCMIGLAKGKKEFDKRETIKKRECEREIQQVMKK